MAKGLAFFDVEPFDLERRTVVPKVEINFTASLSPPQKGYPLSKQIYSIEVQIEVSKDVVYTVQHFIQIGEMNEFIVTLLYVEITF